MMLGSSQETICNIVLSDVSSGPTLLNRLLSSNIFHVYHAVDQLLLLPHKIVENELIMVIISKTTIQQTVTNLQDCQLLFDQFHQYFQEN